MKTQTTTVIAVVAMIAALALVATTPVLTNSAFAHSDNHHFWYGSNYKDKQDNKSKIKNRHFRSNRCEYSVFTRQT
ncbi:MAG: hypothetical protein WBQ25_04095 [Nitrososphaeraceae archaeon]